MSDVPEWAEENGPNWHVRAFAESAIACPYWVRGPICGMLTVVYGCGGYGEVAPEHPGASHDEHGREREPVKIGQDFACICLRCHGTGIRR